MPACAITGRFEDGVLTIENPALPWAAAIAGFLPGDPWERRADGPLEVDIAGRAGTTTLVYGFGPTAGAAREAAARLASDPAASLDRTAADWARALAGLPDDRAVRRALAYGRMLAVPVGEARCILTDHMLLPLSWNRDAYYVARAMLQHDHGLADIVRRHLCGCSGGRASRRAVGRCYLANGQSKPRLPARPAFPLLERPTTSGDTRPPPGPAAARRVRSARPAVGHRAPGRNLSTDETPADDRWRCRIISRAA